MSQGSSILVVDAGNTRIKVALVKGNAIQFVHGFATLDEQALRNFLQDYQGIPAVISSVLDPVAFTALIQKFSGPVFIPDFTQNMPVKLHYRTPETLGFDRICNAVAVASLMDREYGLSIDIGTCIKFDLVDRNSNYLGGSIAPGLDLRYKSLNDFTANLPLLDSRQPAALVGTTTHESIESGVMNGTSAELIEMINRYRKNYKSLTIFVTGGDAQYFDLPSKNDIFVDENLTLKGLYEIYKWNH